MDTKIPLRSGLRRLLYKYCMYITTLSLMSKRTRVFPVTVNLNWQVRNQGHVEHVALKGS